MENNCGRFIPHSDPRWGLDVKTDIGIIDRLTAKQKAMSVIFGGKRKNL